MEDILRRLGRIEKHLGLLEGEEAAEKQEVKIPEATNADGATATAPSGSAAATSSADGSAAPAAAAAEATAPAALQTVGGAAPAAAATTGKKKG